MTAQLRRYRDFALELAGEASSMISAGFASRPSALAKGDGTPVTAVDEAVNAFVLDVVGRAFPEHGMIGEEGSAGTSSWMWVCDPIDGTIPFITGLPLSVFCLALCDEGEPVVAVIADPCSGRVLDAIIGSGTRCDGEQVHVRDTGVARAVIDVEAWAMFNHDVHDLRRDLNVDGAFAVSLASAVRGAFGVACGELAGVVFGGDSPWDAAASSLVIGEAGGITSDLFGSRQRYDRPIRGFVGAGRNLHAELVRRTLAMLPAG